MKTYEEKKLVQAKKGGRKAHRQHGLSPLPVSPLEQLDAVNVVTDLHQIPHHELGAPSFGAGRNLAATRYVSFGQDSRVKRPPATQEMFINNNQSGQETRPILITRHHHQDVSLLICFIKTSGLK